MHRGSSSSPRRASFLCNHGGSRKSYEFAAAEFDRRLRAADSAHALGGEGGGALAPPTKTRPRFDLECDRNRTICFATGKPGKEVTMEAYRAHGHVSSKKHQGHNCYYTCRRRNGAR